MKRLTLNSPADYVWFTGVRGRLFPVVGLHGRVSVEANFGNDLKEKPFVWTRDQGTGDPSAKKEEETSV